MKSPTGSANSRPTVTRYTPSPIDCALFSMDAGIWLGISNMAERNPGIELTVAAGSPVKEYICQVRYTYVSGEIAVEWPTDPGIAGEMVAPSPVANILIVEPTAAGLVALFRVPSSFCM